MLNYIMSNQSNSKPMKKMKLLNVSLNEQRLSRAELKLIYGGSGEASSSHVCYVFIPASDRGISCQNCTNDPNRAEEWACQGSGCINECDTDLAIRECGSKLD